MSATEPSSGVTESAPPVRIGLKLPPPEPPRFSLSFKIFFAAALLIFIGIGGAIAISTFQARRVADAKIASDLTKSGPAWESFQQNRYGELHRALGVVVSNPGLIGVMTLDPLSPATTIDTLKAEQASNARADFLLAADREGRVFARTDKPLGYVADLSRVPTIAGALQGESTQGIWLSGNKLYHVVAQPVLEGGSRVVGVIAAAFAINDEVARSLKRLMNADVVFLADEAKPPEAGRPMLAATTMEDQSRAVLEDVRQRRDVVAAVFRQGKTIGPLALNVSGNTYLAYFLPVRSSTDQLVGAAVALRSRDEELKAFRQIQNTQIVVGLVALAVAFVLSFVLARRITGPVDRLVRATEEVRVGNLESADLPVDSRDEIGILARSFHAMIEELKEKAALEQYVSSLTLNVGGGGETIAATRAGPSAAGAAAGKGQEPQIGLLFAGRYQIQSVNGLRYLSMEFIKGFTLKHMVEQDQLLPTPVALRIAKQVCAGLAAAHDVGVIHRDIKPQNIMIEPTGGLKLMDFGIARLTQDRGMTAAGTVIGTPDYMSPEQARGVPLDFRSDIYSTGVVLYEVFTGTLPFEGDTPLAVVLKHVQEPPPSPQAKNPRIDPKIAAIILKCMQKNADDRFQSVNQLYEA